MALTPEEKAAKKKEQVDVLIAELATFKVTSSTGTENVTPLTGNETVAELKDKLKQAKKDAKAAEKIDATEAVVMHNGQEVRVYSLKVHGENFADLANEFAGHEKDHTVVLR